MPHRRRSGREDTRFRGEIDFDFSSREETIVSEKGEREEHTCRGSHKEKISGAEFFLQPTGIKDEVLKVSRVGWDNSRRALPCSWGESRQTTWGRHHGNGDLKTG